MKKMLRPSSEAASVIRTVIVVLAAIPALGADWHCQTTINHDMLKITGCRATNDNTFFAARLFEDGSVDFVIGEPGVTSGVTYRMKHKAEYRIGDLVGSLEIQDTDKIGDGSAFGFAPFAIKFADWTAFANTLRSDKMIAVRVTDDKGKEHFYEMDLSDISTNVN